MYISVTEDIINNTEVVYVFTHISSSGKPIITSFTAQIEHDYENGTMHDDYMGLMTPWRQNKLNDTY